MATISTTIFTALNDHPVSFQPLQTSSATGINVNERLIKIACSNCNMRELCMPIGLNADELSRIDELVAKRPIVKRGTALFRAGDKFKAMYAISILVTRLRLKTPKFAHCPLTALKTSPERLRRFNITCTRL